MKQKFKFFGFPCCSTREDLSIDVSIIATVGLILTKLGLFLFSGYGLTDTFSESLYGNMSAQKRKTRRKKSTRSSKLRLSCRLQHASQYNGDA